MELQKITSGKDVVHFLHHGYRLAIRKSTKDSNRHYFICVTEGCNTTLGILGDLDGDFKLNYHKIETHNHKPDFVANIVAATLSDFRAAVRADPNTPLLGVYNEICEKAIASADESIKKELETKLPSYYSIKDQGYRILSKARFLDHTTGKLKRKSEKLSMK